MNGQLTDILKRCQLLGLLALALLVPGAYGADPEETGTVVLRWTAPGDDGYSGRAYGYELRHQPAALGPLDTEDEWRQATLAPAVPQPSSAGEIDSTLISNLVPGASYYFGLKAFDTDHNYSPISNSPLRQAEENTCCAGRVGDVNGYGGDEPTIADLSVLIDHLFVDRPVLWCVTEADINQSGGLDPQQGPGGDITIGDIGTLIDYLFIKNTPLFDCQ